ncbi:polysaccharide deacetylase family protein [Frankia sp. Cppng1_Ct_nod]|uniref:polysaccharide deacetylase family protein n=1 Tax=Frankia sp. Cppng1_Ct_nod TaxID=2897162 RepID=UPI0010418DE3|nr:polysaccharide deacetylase family protein [Frankia sp. Cppng1_Ct_nod]
MIYVAVPGALQVALAVRGGRAPEVSVQEPATGPWPVVPAVLADLRWLPEPGHRDPPLILAYHDVSPTSTSPYAVTATAFAEQMSLLAAAGYTAISEGDVLAWLAGAPLPPRPVLITFDDGISGIWRYADPVLAATGMRATAFVITGMVGDRSGYYVSWAELRRLRDSGRWDFGGHTHDGHHEIPISADGTTGPFLTNREWLADTGRLETLAEYETRVRDDLAVQVDDFAGHGLGRPALFAYPFSAVDRPTNDPAVPARLRAAVEATFAASMTNESGAALTTPEAAAARELRRVEILGTTGLDEFAASVARGSPLPVSAGLPAGRWLDDDGHPVAGGAGPLTLRTAPAAPGAPAAPAAPGAAGGWARVRFAPDRTSWWTDYRVSMSLHGLGNAGQAAETVVSLLDGGSLPVRIGLSAGWLSVRSGGSGNVGGRDSGTAGGNAEDNRGETVRTLAEHSLPAAGSHRLDAEVTHGGRLRVSVDGTRVVETSLPVDPRHPVAGGIALVARARSNGGGTVIADALEVAPLTL